MGAPIYLDNNASTAPDPEVTEAVVSCMRAVYANAASHHALGQQAAAAVSEARENVAALVGCPPQSIVFTSGATEANGLAIRGTWEAACERGTRRDTIVVGATEHAAVLDAAASLERSGARVLQAPVDECGIVDPDALRALVDERTLLVSVMAANNETGTIAPLSEVVAIAKEAGAYVHSDATQYVGRLPLGMVDMGLDLLTMSAHKMHGPKGVGALAAARGIPLAAQIHGGGHERGLRSGTLNTPGIVGFGVAATLARQRFGERETVQRLRDGLHDLLHERLEGVSLNGHSSERLPNTLNLRFAGADAEAVMASLARVVCSSGSACSSAVPAPSHVLVAMGLSNVAAHECLRLSLSRTTTADEIRAAADDLIAAIEYVRAEVSVAGTPPIPVAVG